MSGMRTVYIKNSERAEKTSTKHEYELYILKKKLLKWEDNLKIFISEIFLFINRDKILGHQYV